MGNQNRKASKAEMDRIRRVIKDAYPELTPVFGGHGAYGGHRAPRDQHDLVPPQRRTRSVPLERRLADARPAPRAHGA